MKRHIVCMGMVHTFSKAQPMLYKHQTILAQRDFNQHYKKKQVGEVHSLSFKCTIRIEVREYWKVFFI